MKDVENAVREFGARFFDGVSSTVNGLDSATLSGSMPFIVGVLLLIIVVKCFSLPFKLIWNGVYGAVILWLINLIGGFVGFGLKITVIKALIAGFFGIPGVVAIIVWELFAK